MKNFVQFGESVAGYNIPVLNEREIRASAGILFLLMLIAFKLVIFDSNFLLLKYFIIIFLTDLTIRVFINPKFAPSLIIGRLIVRKQVPEYVGAPQKKFAWKIGLALSSLMFLLVVVLNSYSIIAGLSCLICLVFLFFETAFGICMGCKVYKLIYKKKVQYCPGEVCDSKSKQEIQKTSRLQIVVVFAFLAYIFAAIFLLNDNFSQKPNSLWDVVGLKNKKN